MDYHWFQIIFYFLLYLVLVVVVVVVVAVLRGGGGDTGRRQFDSRRHKGHKNSWAFASIASSSGACSSLFSVACMENNLEPMIIHANFEPMIILDKIFYPSRARRSSPKDARYDWWHVTCSL